MISIKTNIKAVKVKKRNDCSSVTVFGSADNESVSVRMSNDEIEMSVTNSEQEKGE